MARHEPSITLSPDRGVNPRMTRCEGCGQDTPVLALLGDADYLHICRSCDKKILGKKNMRKCPLCGALALVADRRLDEYEKIPMGLCDACTAKNVEMGEVVKAGGVYWRCSDCGSTGAIRGEADLAKAVRERANIQAPDPVGVEFSKQDCPVCSPERIEHEASSQGTVRSDT